MEYGVLELKIVVEMGAREDVEDGKEEMRVRVLGRNK